MRGVQQKQLEQLTIAGLQSHCGASAACQGFQPFWRLMFTPKFMMPQELFEVESLDPGKEILSLASDPFTVELRIPCATAAAEVKVR